MNLLYYLIYGVIFGALSSLAVEKKGRDQFGWFLIGLFFGVFGLVAALIVSNISKAKNDNMEKLPMDFIPDEYKKKCSDCAEMIKLEARVCRYCSRKFTEEEVLKHINEEKNKVIDFVKPKREGDIITCPKCYTLNPENFEECRICGYNLG